MDGVQRLYPVTDIRAGTGKRPERNGKFGQLLTEKLEQEKLRISRHASARMEERGVVLSEKMQADLSAAVETAQKKGARNALVVGDNSMFIVNVPGRVIVTAVTKDEMKENIFTNIDSAVWM